MFQLKKGSSSNTTYKELALMLPKKLSLEDVFFVCIGTDRSTGDSMGPMVGTMLEELNYSNVIGTIDHPLHAMNMVERLESVPINKTIIAIDAALGKEKDIGCVFFSKGGVRPGSAVKKELPPIGDFSIKGVVNIGGYMEFATLQNTRLKVVKDLSSLIVESITHRFPVKEEIPCSPNHSRTN